MKKIFLTALTAIVLLLALSYQFWIKVKVDCASQYGSCPSDIVTILKQNQNKSLFAAKRNIKKLFSKNLTISEYAFQYRVPNTLLVNLVVKKPSFSVLDLSTSKHIFVDYDGNILEIGQSSVLPEVRVQNQISTLGSKVGQEILFALRLQKGVYDMYQTKQGSIDDNGLVVVLPSQIKVIFPLQGDVDLLLGSLRLIYSKLENSSEISKFSEIDLRFKNPVLR